MRCHARYRSTPLPSRRMPASCLRGGGSDTPALTMGMGTILRAKKILIMANGAAKRDAVATMLAGGLTTACPASLLSLHADVTLVCDGAALGR